MKRWYSIAAALAFQVLPHAVSASEASDAVQSVAASKMSTVARINGATRPVIYVGQFDGCDSVSIQNAPGRYEHFRVCGNQVTARNTVSPSWPKTMVPGMYSAPWSIMRFCLVRLHKWTPMVTSSPLVLWAQPSTRAPMLK